MRTGDEVLHRVGQSLGRLPGGALCVSARGTGGYDIVTRVFAPGLGIPEDPATGSAHCGFAPLWCERLDVELLRSFQASPRGGYISCSWRRGGERVGLSGTCRTFLVGTIAD
jgi:predicted PhzF superfamily epimerase YddE/YHI9